MSPVYTDSCIEPYKETVETALTRAVTWNCVTTGGAKVLDGICAALKLDEKRMLPSRAVLHDFGNISSSTTW